MNNGQARVLSQVISPVAENIPGRGKPTMSPAENFLCSHFTIPKQMQIFSGG